nr:MAG TPA_asm: hypothetical protein [Caudoviricetes sp.]
MAAPRRHSPEATRLTYPWVCPTSTANAFWRTPEVLRNVLRSIGPPKVYVTDEY